MQNTSVFHTVICIGFFASIAAFLIPDKMSSKWISILCIAYMLLNIITSMKDFSFVLKNDVEEITSAVEKTTIQVSESADKLIEENLEKKVSEYIEDNYGIYTWVDCDISNGHMISVKYEKDIQSNIISDVNKKFFSEIATNRMDNYD